VDLAGTLKVGGSPSCVGPVAAFAQNTRDEVRFVGGSGSHVGALAAHPGVKQASHVLQGPAVRRLTPLECERLQGFPDNWTNVEFRGKPAPDGRRYKALGNAMAVPVVKWIGERVEKAV
ncbi:MAG: DNA cytosine methyltransferase, partial [Eggerthella lenta]